MITSINEFKNTINEDFYSNDTILELSKAFNANVVIDKEQKIKPLYGGGSITQIGYVVTPKFEKNYSKFILEGITINGDFVDASIIIYIGETAYVHASLNKKIDRNTNLFSSIIDALKERLENFKNH